APKPRQPTLPSSNPPPPPPNKAATAGRRKLLNRQTRPASQAPRAPAPPDTRNISAPHPPSLCHPFADGTARANSHPSRLGKPFAQIQSSDRMPSFACTPSLPGTKRAPSPPRRSAADRDTEEQN